MLQTSAVSRSTQASTSLPPTLRRGARGPDVQRLQRALWGAGFPPGPVDGDFGPMTRRAVMAFQRAKGLEVDGIVGPHTWGALLNHVQNTQNGPIPHTGNTFIDHVAAGAVAGQTKYGVPASVTIAQAILESGWGKSGLSVRAHNLFGIKGTGPAGSVSYPTKEYLNGRWVTVNAAFRAYHNDAESLEDHARLLATSGYYKKAMSLRNDPRAFANALTGVYATSPTYGRSLIQIMDQYNLYRFDHVH